MKPTPFEIVALEQGTFGDVHAPLARGVVLRMTRSVGASTDCVDERARLGNERLRIVWVERVAGGLDVGDTVRALAIKDAAPATGLSRTDDWIAEFKKSRSAPCT